MHSSTCWTRSRRRSRSCKEKRPAGAGLFCCSMPEKPSQERVFIAYYNHSALKFTAFLAKIISPRQHHIPFCVIRPMQLVKTVQTEFSHTTTSQCCILWFILNHIFRIQYKLHSFQEVVQKMGNFIPKPYSTEQVSIRVDTELLAQVEAAANKYNMSRNAFINECIRYAMANMADPPEADPQ